MLLLASGGCQRGINEGVELVADGSGQHFSIEAPTAPLMDYDNIEVETFEVDFPRTPETLPNLLRPLLVEELRDRGLPAHSAGPRVLLIRGRIIYYEAATGAMKQVWGPLEEAVAIVELVDKSSGDTVARAGCVGRTTSSAGMGPATKADGLAEAIAGWIGKYRPSPK